MNILNHYRLAGVNIDAADELISRIKPMMRDSASALLGHQSVLTAAAGGYAATVQMPNLPGCVLAACSDGVGTKVELLAKHGLPQVAGIDVVAMCVNDMLCVGALPLFFLDYYACDSLSVDFAARVIEGIAEGCRQADCALIGGETAEMPGIYQKETFDLAGFAVGVAQETALLKESDIVGGDIVVAIASNGAHSNGYSLIRQLLQKHTPPPEVMQLLLTPTRIYCKSIKALRQQVSPRGLAHITGGGVMGNLPRILPSNTAAYINDFGKLPALFEWLQNAGDIHQDEMRRVFNCGIGMVAVFAAGDVETAMACLRQSGENCWILGEIIAAEGAPQVVLG